MNHKERSIRTNGNVAIQLLLHARQGAAEAELWRTYQSLDQAVKLIGWELAEQLKPFERRKKENPS